MCCSLTAPIMQEEENAMLVDFEQVSSSKEEKAIIRAKEKTTDIQSAIEILEGNAGGIAVLNEGKTYICRSNSIYYIESVDKRSYVYTKDHCYETKYRLYELEEMLTGYFVRCSKAMIVNLRKVKSVKSDIGGRLNATLLNEEEIIISRSYVKEIKRRLDL